MNWQGKMNGIIKVAVNNSPANIKSAPFHSTPVLHRRRRRNHFHPNGNAYRGSEKRADYYSRNYRKMNSQQELLRNASAFAETIFQDFDHDEYEPSFSRGRSWYRPNYRDSGFRSSGSNHKKTRGFYFCDDEIEVETIFRSTFGGNRYGFWSFINDEQARSSTRYYNNYRSSRNWTYQSEEDSDSDSDSLEPDFSKERKTLGMCISGPINLEDVKNAYRRCALKWHPDRHQGSSKVAAEEKFKVCSAAYQTLCDEMALRLGSEETY